MNYISVLETLEILETNLSTESNDSPAKLTFATINLMLNVFV